jgi:hypothetical protein
MSWFVSVDSVAAFHFGFFPYVEHDAKSIPLAGWQFAEVTH